MRKEKEMTQETKCSSRLEEAYNEWKADTSDKLYWSGRDPMSSDSVGNALNAVYDLMDIVETFIEESKE